MSCNNVDIDGITVCMQFNPAAVCLSAGRNSVSAELLRRIAVSRSGRVGQLARISGAVLRDDKCHAEYISVSTEISAYDALLTKLGDVLQCPPANVPDDITTLVTHREVEALLGIADGAHAVIAPLYLPLKSATREYVYSKSHIAHCTALQLEAIQAVMRTVCDIVDKLARQIDTIDPFYRNKGSYERADRHIS